ncbi:guanine nucleotide-binding protein subunit alpha [Hypoxylon texense]
MDEYPTEVLTTSRMTWPNPFPACGIRSLVPSTEESSSTTSSVTIPPTNCAILRTRARHRRKSENGLSTIVVNVDGAVRHYVGSGSQAAWGVYVANGAGLNGCGRLAHHIEPSIPKAQLEALWQGLVAADSIICTHRAASSDFVSSVRIACGSGYLVPALNFRIWDWIDAGGFFPLGAPRTALRRDVGNSSKRSSVFDPEYGANVKLGSVPPHMNREAEALANLALDLYRYTFHGEDGIDTDDEEAAGQLSSRSTEQN